MATWRPDLRKCAHSKQSEMKELSDGCPYARTREAQKGFSKYLCGRSLLKLGDKFQYSNSGYNPATITNASHKDVHAFLSEKH
jgi:hypothetical protein